MAKPGTSRAARRRRRRILWLAAAVLVAGAAALTAVVVRWDPRLSAEEYVQRSDEREQAGDVKGAIIELKNALQEDPDLADARWRLGRIYLRVGNGAAAVKEIEFAQKHGLHGREVTVTLLQAMLLQGRYDEVLGRIATLEPGDDETDLLVLTGEAKLGMREVSEAKAAFHKAVALAPGNANAERGLAKIALAERKIEEAEKHLDVSLESANENVQSWLLKGELELTRGEREAAERAFRTALELDPSHAGAQIGVARALLAQGKAEAAEEQLEPLHALNPRHPIVNYFLAVAARQKDDFEAATTRLRQVLEVRPGHAQSLLLLGSIHYVQREFAQGDEHLRRFVARSPGSVVGRKLYAANLLQLGRPTDAIEALRPIVSETTDDPQLLALLGSAYVSNRQFDQGMQFLEKAAELAPDVAAIRTQLAVSHLAVGSSDEAVSELESAVELDAKFVNADMLLVYAHLRKQEFDAAYEVARTLAEKQPENPVALNLMAAARLGRGDVAGARRHFEEALVLQPDFLTANLNLARLDLREGDTENARARLEKILETRPNHPVALLELARIENAGGEPAAAAGYLERSRAQNPEALGPRLLLVPYLLDTGKRDDALAVAEEAEKLAPENPLVRLNLGRALSGVGRHREGIEALTDLAGRFPRSPDIHYHLGAAQARAGQLDAARGSLRKTRELAPDHERATLALARLELRAGHPKEALVLAGELASREETAVSGRTLEGQIWLREDEPAKALAAFDAAFERRPTGAGAINRYRALAAMGRAADGQRLLRDWLAPHPEDAAVRLVLAGSAHRAGQADPAIRDYELVLERDPDNALALNNLAWLYFEKKDPRAVTLAKKAYELVPSRAEILDTYGWLLVESGKVEQGLALLDRAVKRNPRIADVRYHRAAALARSGDESRARWELEELLASEASFSERENAEALLESLK